jgi:hypothetical protein
MTACKWGEALADLEKARDNMVDGASHILPHCHAPCESRAMSARHALRGEEGGREEECWT